MTMLTDNVLMRRFERMLDSPLARAADAEDAAEKQAKREALLKEWQAAVAADEAAAPARRKELETARQELRKTEAVLRAQLQRVAAAQQKNTSASFRLDRKRGKFERAMNELAPPELADDARRLEDMFEAFRRERSRNGGEIDETGAAVGTFGKGGHWNQSFTTDLFSRGRHGEAIGRARQRIEALRLTAFAGAELQRKREEIFASLPEITMEQVA